ncbi:hypothetical protein ACP70R_040266 [Stipagrostis hirtigluma subsp. patula]
MSRPLACGRRGGGRFELPRQQPPVVDVGCSCRTPRLLRSLISTLKSHACGGGGGNPKSPPHASSSLWSSSTAATAFTSSTTPTATTATTAASSWGPVAYAPNANTLCDNEAEAEAEAEARRQRRRRRRRRRRSSRCRREQGSWGAAAAAAAALDDEETAAAVAVEVESAAPYEDFRESMVAMVTEKEMYAWEDLNALLHQFLALNSPRHHPLILAAFADLWTPRGGVFCPPSPCLL